MENIIYNELHMRGYRVDVGVVTIAENKNGKVYVHVQRGNETLHLMVVNNEHVAGGSSVYEVINQYQTFKSESIPIWMPNVLDKFGFSEREYEDYAAMYKNVIPL